ncbi:TIGR04165 family Cys-rich peptide [Methanobrevibacter sp. OttesenSCG-928-K11]|nr:TIGR04165 family Cys-rich peptide [Methanobrevibacter sp. OttesenSCG-928-K11]
MKLEDLLAKCPECGSQDKTAHRRMIDNHKAHAELDCFKCENCGYVFEKKEKNEDDEKSKIIKELNKL